MNAGLVILAPFLPALFTRCGLLVDGAFAQPDSRLRGLHLLHYLVSGDTPLTRDSVPLCRLLVSLPDDGLVPILAPLTSPEKSAADSLLESVCHQWARGTSLSVQALRVNYLCRPGWLRQHERGWNLEVARRKRDDRLLLLPWNFLRIQATWMPQPLVVDWLLARAARPKPT